MFSGLMAKLSAGLAILSGILFFWAKTERAAKQKAQHENKIKDKIKENHDKQEADQIEVLDNEEKNIETDLQKHRNSSRSDRASRL